MEAKIRLVMALRDLRQYSEKGTLADGNSKNAWIINDGKARALALSHDPLEHVSDTGSTEEMRIMISNIFERHTLLSTLTACWKFYNLTLPYGEKLLFCRNQEEQPRSTLKSKSVDIENKEIEWPYRTLLHQVLKSLLQHLILCGMRTTWLPSPSENYTPKKDSLVRCLIMKRQGATIIMAL